MQELYEAWFDQKVDIKMDVLEFIYRRAEWARYVCGVSVCGMTRASTHDVM